MESNFVIYNMNNNKLVNNYLNRNANNNKLVTNIINTNPNIVRTAKIKQDVNIIESVQKNITENDIIRDAIIAPTKVTLSNPEKIKIKEQINKLNSEYDNKGKSHLSHLKTYWNSRTNDPYKSIITDEKYYGKFLKENLVRSSILPDNEKSRLQKELIVHKVTDADTKGVKEKYKVFNSSLEKHNNELKNIYSLNKQTEHLKKFEYNHRERFRVKYNPTDHNDLKANKINLYKKAQHEMEQSKIKKDSVIEDLINNGVIDNTQGTKQPTTEREREQEQEIQSVEPQKRENRTLINAKSNIVSTGPTHIIPQNKVSNVAQKPVNRIRYKINK